MLPVLVILSGDGYIELAFVSTGLFSPNFRFVQQLWFVLEILILASAIICSDKRPRFMNWMNTKLGCISVNVFIVWRLLPVNQLHCSTIFPKLCRFHPIQKSGIFHQFFAYFQRIPHSSWRPAVLMEEYLRTCLYSIVLLTCKLNYHIKGV